jgi:hypothetical protein
MLAPEHISSTDLMSMTLAAKDEIGFSVLAQAAC